MHVNVQASHDKKFPLEVEVSDSTGELKKKIATSQNIPVEEIRLIFAGRILKETDTVESLRMADGNTLHMVRSAKAAKSAAPNPLPQPTPAASVARPPAEGPAVSGMPLNNLAQMLGSMGMPSAPGGDVFGGGDMAAMLNNPAIQSAMNNPEMVRQSLEMMAANPQLMQSILQMNPTFRDAPPHVQQMMQRPEFLRMVLEMSMGMPPPPPPPPPAASGMSPSTLMATGATGGGDQQFVQYLQTLESMIGPSSPSQQASSEPPEVRFQSQLQQLTEMGFYDTDANIRALLATGGNVNLAIERLLQNM